ncbi:MAG TPA: plasmid pRiA4b ORF-3 family protein [Terriglobales bacterium]|nr:plasmid pRiA4b ORF-3 family protein [Terriglobales bacterium]
MPFDAIIRLKITLAEVKPAVVRTLAVPLTITLDRLHLTIQAAMGWTNSHFWEFRAAEVGFGLRDPEAGNTDVIDAGKTRLLDVIEDTGVKTIHYFYDFGDGWDHVIRLGRITNPEPGAAYPCLLDASGRRPPEDIGGPWGYAELLEALADPNHERREELEYVVESGFDPNLVDVATLAAEVAALAERWSRNPAQPSPHAAAID